MGVFDTYGQSQLKAGDPWQKQYEVGSRVEIPDGVYPGSENFIIIKDGVFIAEVETLYDYWGDNPLTAEEVANNYEKIHDAVQFLKDLRGATHDK